MNDIRDFRESWYERDGVRLHAVEAGPEDGPLYILLHGFPEFWYGWRKQIPALAAAGFHVVAPDQRGYNLSDKPASIASYAITELAADVLNIARGRPFHLGGHDWGAAVAWAVALSAPQMVQRLTILNVPHPAVMIKHLRSDPTQMLRSWYMFFFQLPVLPEAAFRRIGRQSLVRTSRPGTFTEAELDAYSQSWNEPGCVTGMINWYRALMRVRPPELKDPTIRVPTTVVWGKKDKFLKAVIAEESVAFCSSGSRLVYIDEASHWVQHEEAERVSRLLMG